jgi:hypothetical protein
MKSVGEVVEMGKESYKGAVGARILLFIGGVKILLMRSLS